MVVIATFLCKVLKGKQYHDYVCDNGDHVIRLRGLFSKKAAAATNTMTMDKPANSSVSRSCDVMMSLWITS